jgi:hypothetical protein
VSIEAAFPFDELHCVHLDGKAFLGAITASRIPAGTLLPLRSATMVLCTTAADAEEASPAVAAICGRAEA